MILMWSKHAARDVLVGLDDYTLVQKIGHGYTFIVNPLLHIDSQFIANNNNNCNRRGF